MAVVRYVEYDDANPEVRAIYDEIMEIRDLDFVPNFYKALGTHPPTLRRFWESLKVVINSRRIDPLTQELIAIAVCTVTNCEYCVCSHVAAARKLGMDDEMLGELLSTVAVFSDTSRLAAGYQLDLEEAFRPPTDG
jgi:AhpD family alkylhydroperoxidase